MKIARLDRTIIRISGDTALSWLAGLITNNLQDDMSFAALLSPQGKILADFFIHKTEGGLLLETPRKFSDDLMSRLKLYRLREKIDLEAADLRSYVIWEAGTTELEEMGETSIAAHLDPRGSPLGWRLITRHIDTDHDPEDYDDHRLSLGVPDSQWDFDGSTMFPANANMDLLSGVDYQKGCFIGQEVVSRMYRRTEVRKRMRGVTYEGDLSESQLLQNGRKAGQILHSRSGRGMALVRLDRIQEDVALLAGDIKITLMPAYPPRVSTHS